MASLSAKIMDRSVLSSTTKVKMGQVCVAIIYYFKLYLLC